MCINWQQELLKRRRPDSLFWNWMDIFNSQSVQYRHRRWMTWLLKCIYSALCVRPLEWAWWFTMCLTWPTLWAFISVAEPLVIVGVISQCRERKSSFPGIIVRLQWRPVDCAVLGLFRYSTDYTVLTEGDSGDSVRHERFASFTLIQSKKRGKKQTKASFLNSFCRLSLFSRRKCPHDRLHQV